MEPKVYDTDIQFYVPADNALEVDAMIRDIQDIVYKMFNIDSVLVGYNRE